MSKSTRGATNNSKTKKKSNIKKKPVTKKKKMVKTEEPDSETIETTPTKKVTTVKQTKTTKTKVNVNNEVDNEVDFEAKIEEITQALRENYAQQKKLMNDLKELMNLHKKEVKLSAKSGTRANSGKHSGFNKPETVPEPLRKLLKIEDEMLPRSKITNLMYQYFTTNQMYSTKTKKEIIPNDKIKKIFGMKKNDVINFYNIQTWLKKIYDENAPNTILRIED